MMVKKINLAIIGMVIFPVFVNAADSASEVGSKSVPAPGQEIPNLNLPKLPSTTQDAYKAVTQEASPLSPDQIRSLRKIVDEAERASSEPPRFIPKPVSTTVTALLAPGATPPVIRLSSNYVSSLLFVDQAGNPLNVADVTPGGASAFTITPNPVPKNTTNKIDISPKSPYANGNVSVLLEGITTPISLTLVSGQREVDYRVDVRVKGRFSNAGNASASSLPEGANSVMLTFLEGVTPDGAVVLKSSNSDIQAWSYLNRFYVRTNVTLLSPAYVSTVRSADGTAVYEIPPTPVLITLSGGSTRQDNLSGF